MRSFLRRLRIFLRETRWELKMALGRATTDHRELLFRIIRLPDDIRMRNIFAFSWGKIEFTKSGALRSQFEEIVPSSR